MVFRACQVFLHFIWNKAMWGGLTPPPPPMITHKPTKKLFFTPSLIMSCILSTVPTYVRNILITILINFKLLYFYLIFPKHFVICAMASLSCTFFSMLSSISKSKSSSLSEELRSSSCPRYLQDSFVNCSFRIRIRSDPYHLARSGSTSG